MPSCPKLPNGRFSSGAHGLPEETKPYSTVSIDGTLRSSLLSARLLDSFMAERNVKYKGVYYKSNKKKYTVAINIKNGEEDRVTAKHQGKKQIHGGLFTDPLLGAQLVDK
jgi:hypothetical protein